MYFDMFIKDVKSFFKTIKDVALKITQ